MEQSFNFKRSILLFKLIFISYVNDRSSRLLGVIFICIIIFVTLCVRPYGESLDYVPIATGVGFSFGIFAIIGVRLSVQEYDHYSDKLNVCTSYMLPASVNEKFFMPFFTSFILTVGLASIVFVIGGIFQLLGDVIFSSNTIVEYVQYDYRIIPLFVWLLFANSLCCLSSVLFKNGAIRCFGVAIFVLVIGKSVRMYISEHVAYLSSLSASAWYCSVIMLSLLFWLIAYCIFRKRQLNK